jgi:hypothetical protein
MDSMIVGLFGLMAFLFVVFAVLKATTASHSPDSVKYAVTYEGTGTGISAVRDMVTWDRNRQSPQS